MKLIYFYLKNNKARYRSVVSQNEITLVFKILGIFRPADPLSRVQMNTSLLKMELLSEIYQEF